ncbi:MAG: nucleotidyltransferase family protein, partial [Sphingomonadaceae bacterium]|nr:nucleotidyltransferase family protein [Sphingomonadaceae bacterium]
MSAFSDRELQFLANAVGRHASSGAEPVSADDVDWARFLLLVERHRVGALVAASSTQLNLPPAVVDALAEDESVNAANYLRSRAVLDRLEARFSAEAIDWAVLKGLAIAERYYERPSLREMIDVDLLVDRDR